MTASRMLVALLAVVVLSTLRPVSGAAAPNSYFRRGFFTMGGGVNAPVGENSPYFNSSGAMAFALMLYLST